MLLSMRHILLNLFQRIIGIDHTQGQKLPIQLHMLVKTNSGQVWVEWIIRMEIET